MSYGKFENVIDRLFRRQTIRFFSILFMDRIAEPMIHAYRRRCQPVLLVWIGNFYGHATVHLFPIYMKNKCTFELSFGRPVVRSVADGHQRHLMICYVRVYHNYFGLGHSYHSCCRKMYSRAMGHQSHFGFIFLCDCGLWWLSERRRDSIMHSTVDAMLLYE